MIRRFMVRLVLALTVGTVAGFCVVAGCPEYIAQLWAASCGVLYAVYEIPKRETDE